MTVTNRCVVSRGHIAIAIGGVEIAVQGKLCFCLFPPASSSTVAVAVVVAVAVAVARNVDLREGKLHLMEEERRGQQPMQV